MKSDIPGNVSEKAMKVVLFPFYDSKFISTDFLISVMKAAAFFVVHSHETPTPPEQNRLSRETAFLHGSLDSSSC